MYKEIIYLCFIPNARNENDAFEKFKSQNYNNYDKDCNYIIIEDAIYPGYRIFKIVE